VIGDRALHSRAAVVAQLAVAYMHGMREAGMAATAKHFPGHGAVVGDSHLSLPVDRRQYADMEPDLRPYRLLIENGLAAVMVAHVQYPDVDAVPASFSRRWIGDVLRGDLRFQGLVIADDLSMSGAAAMGDLVERVQRALAAGCELLPVCNARAQVLQLLADLRFAPDPALHLKLARMRGRPHFEIARLRETAQWQLASLAVAEIDAPQELRLKGASA
jgi:beta-N-acetylhexosaminidase